MIKLKDIDSLYDGIELNLEDISLSANETYASANVSFELAESALEKFINNIGINSNDIFSFYSEYCSIAELLAESCEKYLKALYLYENIESGETQEQLWSNTKNTEYEKDEKGNYIYQTSQGIKTYAKYDDNGNQMFYENGKPIYIDENGNTYNENNRGSKIKIKGHDLKRLINNLREDSKILLLIRMLLIPKEETGEYSSVDISDLVNSYLYKKNYDLPFVPLMTSEQYYNLLDCHNRIYIEARYPGERKPSLNIQFLYHLATQIKAVVQYKMNPKKDQMFTLTYEDISKLPSEFDELVSFYPYFMSKELIELITSNEGIQKKIYYLFSKNCLLPSNISPKNFYNMIMMMDLKEILFVFDICYVIENNMQLTYDLTKSMEYNYKISKIVDRLRTNKISSNRIVELCCHIKSISGISIYSNSFVTFFDTITEVESKLYDGIIHDLPRRLDSIVLPNENMSML